MTGAGGVAGALRTARDRRPARWLAAVAPAAALAVAAGPAGVAAGLAVAAAGLWSPPAAAALAHVWLVALLSGESGTLVAVEAAVLALLCVPEEGGVVRSALATTAGALLLGGVAWLALRRTGSVVVAGGALLVVAVAVAGALDRTARVRLGESGGQP